KIIPGFAAKYGADTDLNSNKLSSEIACLVSTDNPASTTLDQLNGLNMGLDFGVNCFNVLNIVANDDDASDDPVDSMTGGTAIANILVNDTLDGQVATIDKVTITVLDNAGQDFVV